LARKKVLGRTMAGFRNQLTPFQCSSHFIKACHAGSIRKARKLGHPAHHRFAGFKNPKTQPRGTPGSATCPILAVFARVRLLNCTHCVACRKLSCANIVILSERHGTGPTEQSSKFRKTYLTILQESRSSHRTRPFLDHCPANQSFHILLA
jgi:hypothetical protein